MFWVCKLKYHLSAAGCRCPYPTNYRQ
jgi:hypothetical protein